MILKNAEVFIGNTFTKADIHIYKDRFGTIEYKVPKDKPGKFSSIQSINQHETEKDITIDCSGKKIIPGFIELHSHGCIGYDFTTASVSDMEKMCEFYAANGITSILATTMTIDYATYKKAMVQIKNRIESQKEGSRIIGINMEGPFLGTDKKGAHDSRYLMPIDEKIFKELNDLSGDNIKIINLDPNLPGSIEFIKNHSKNKIISLAHTSCGYNTAVKAIKAGASHITHLFNAMNDLHHREPGIVGALSDFDVYADLICDGIHVHPAVIRLIYKVAPGRLNLISDSMSATGLNDGVYELGGQKVYVNNQKVTLKDGTIAGSTTTLYKEFKNIINYGIPVEQVVLSATLIPAKAIKADHEIGSIETGKKADFIIMDQDYNIEKVYRDGVCIKSI